MAHTNKGGLQGWSVGENYPWTIIVQGDLFEYRAFNCVTQQVGPLRATYREAAEDMHGYIARADLVKAILFTSAVPDYAQLMKRAA